MTHIIRITDEQIDDLVYSELEFQRECLELEEYELYEAFTKVMELFKTPEVKEETYINQQTYMYGNYNSISVPSAVNYSFHLGV